MAGNFKRGQIVLRRENGEAGGFVRIEQEGARTTVEVRVSGVADGARAALLREDGSELLWIGAVRGGEARCGAQGTELAGAKQAMVSQGAKLLLAGGAEGCFAAIARRLARQESARPGRQSAPPARAARSAPEKQAIADNAETQSPATARKPSFALEGAPACLREAFTRPDGSEGMLRGVAGLYAPEPPPGLLGFRWVKGYWVGESAKRDERIVSSE